MKLLTGAKVTDIQAGLKAFRSALKKIFGFVLVKKFAYDVKMLCVVSLLKLKVAEMPAKIKLGSSLGCLIVWMHLYAPRELTPKHVNINHTYTHTRWAQETSPYPTKLTLDWQR